MHSVESDPGKFEAAQTLGAHGVDRWRNSATAYGNWVRADAVGDPPTKQREQRAKHERAQKRQQAESDDPIHEAPKAPKAQAKVPLLARALALEDRIVDPVVNYQVQAVNGSDGCQCAELYQRMQWEYNRY